MQGKLTIGQGFLKGLGCGEGRGDISNFYVCGSHIL